MLHRRGPGLLLRACAPPRAICVGSIIGVSYSSSSAAAAARFHSARRPALLRVLGSAAGGGGARSHSRHHGASAAPPLSLTQRVSAVVSLARQLLPSTVGGFGALVAVYGTWRVLVWSVNSFLSLDMYNVFEYGFAAGAGTMAAVGFGALRAWRLTSISPDAAFRAAMAVVDVSPAAEAALGTNIRAGVLKAYTASPAHVQARRGLAWVEPRIQLLFQVVGELGTAMVTAEAVLHRGALAFTVVAIDVLPTATQAARVIVLLGSEDKLHVRGTLRGFLQTERAAHIPTDKAEPTDEELVEEQRKLDPVDGAAAKL